MVSGVTYHVVVTVVCYLFLVGSTVYMLLTMKPRPAESELSEATFDKPKKVPMIEAAVDQETNNELPVQKTRICFFGNFILGAILTSVLSAIHQPSNWVTWFLISGSLNSVINLSGVLRRSRIGFHFEVFRLQSGLELSLHWEF